MYRKQCGTCNPRCSQCSSSSTDHAPRHAPRARRYGTMLHTRFSAPRIRTQGSGAGSCRDTSRPCRAEPIAAHTPTPVAIVSHVGVREWASGNQSSTNTGLHHIHLRPVPALDCSVASVGWTRSLESCPAALQHLQRPMVYGALSVLRPMFDMMSSVPADPHGPRH